MCQKTDWEKGHSKTCASGHTFPQEILDTMRVADLETRKCDAESVPRRVFEKRRDEVFKKFPPPADRER
jgi:hypothetical protein